MCSCFNLLAVLMFLDLSGKPKNDGEVFRKGGSQKEPAYSQKGGGLKKIPKMVVRR